MRKTYKLSAFALAFIIAVAGFVPAAAYGNNAKQYSEGIIEYSLQKSSADSVQEWIDGELTNNAGTGSEWYIIALSNGGDYDFTNYNNALNNYLSKNEVGSASSRLKFALAFIAIGDKTNPYINKALGNSIGEQGIMSLVFGLHLLNNGCKCDAYSVNGLIDELISLQLADGGFSVMGEYGDVDVTAMTVQALSAHYIDNPCVESVVNDALDFLSARQLENGGYSAYGVQNPESSAQVIIALSSLGVDVCTDDRFIKNGNNVFDGLSGFVLADGSFCHQAGGGSDSTATAQGLGASIAYANMKSNKSAFYVFDDARTASEELVTDLITAKPTETNSTEPNSATETTALDDNTSGFTEILSTESDTQKAERTETDKEKSACVRIIIIAVCVVTLVMCAVLLITEKRKFIVIVIIAAVAVIALSVKISGDKSRETIGSVTISISCEVIKSKDKSFIPKDGIILEETEVVIENGDTVYDVFSEICKKENILFSANMGYIEGINNIFEMDFGKSSGWIYFVNGEAPTVGSRSYKLADGDKIEWYYTCDLGEDLDIKFEK